MGVPRVGGSAVMLPNGDAVLVGGAQVRPRMLNRMNSKSVHGITVA
jgi:hypothetical protein